MLKRPWRAQVDKSEVEYRGVVARPSTHIRPAPSVILRSPPPPDPGSVLHVLCQQRTSSFLISHSLASCLLINSGYSRLVIPKLFPH
ncbi:hypothetical protein PNOK_0335000 [Pyrrhoderma noxium]|uniref:Uncharacterized protein n=1 Tax=Pyrrhoderma noxium TaxID=2282107 RepID=A0A286UM98_9AGAM|nr:hypothetical protein PNOK_0335000 [Pyrrhoderma noxium]